MTWQELKEHVNSLDEQHKLNTGESIFFSFDVNKRFVNDALNILYLRIMKILNL